MLGLSLLFLGIGLFYYGIYKFFGAIGVFIFIALASLWLVSLKKQQ
jgi:hypothetical protein